MKTNTPKLKQADKKQTINNNKQRKDKQARQELTYALIKQF